MTTIAYDGKTIASDRFYQTCYGDKLAVVRDYIVGFTGPPLLLLKIQEYFTSGGDLDLEDNEALVVHIPTGEARIYDGDMDYCVVDAPVAIGTGWALATGAMSVGATALEAVRIAALHDSGTKVDKGENFYNVGDLREDLINLANSKG